MKVIDHLTLNFYSIKTLTCAFLEKKKENSQYPVLMSLCRLHFLRILAKKKTSGFESNKFRKVHFDYSYTFCLN